MVRKHFLITEEHVDFLFRLPGQASIHLRRALDDYIQKIREFNASASQSRRKESE